jgi:nitronate monooxygenase
LSPSAAAFVEGLRRQPVPVIAAPLFIISNPQLVIEQCKAGVIGAMPALNARPASQLDDWLAEITEALAEHNARHPQQPAAPFAINQIVHKSNDRLEHDMALCVKYRVPVIITSLGARPEINDAAHSYGGVVLHDVINNAFARKAIDKGADGLVAVAVGAGGHAGLKSPFALIQEIRQWFDGPVALNAGLDPDALPEGDLKTMNFGGDAPKAWRDIWGSGQGIGAIRQVLPARELIARWVAEYAQARARLSLG